MKSQHSASYILLLIFCLVLSISRSAVASHAVGGEITYTHLLGNNYLIHVTFYRDCYGIAAPGSMTVNISSNQCAVSTSLALIPIPGTGQEYTHVCAGLLTNCQGGTVPGFQKWEYENTFAFPAQCADWLISTDISARNAAITTIQNPSASNIYLEARLNNSSNDNSSPVFTINPIMMMCINMDLHFNNGVIDADGDSLVYSLIPSRIAPNTNVTYLPPYSAQHPISSMPDFALDSITGDVFVHPTAPEVGVITYEVMDYRNGELMGSVIRDVIVYTVLCTNELPELSGVFGTNLFTIYVLPDVPFCFDVFSSDFNNGDSISLTWNNAIPGATFTSAGNPFPTGTFCWTPTLNDVRPQPYTFTVEVLDNACPRNGEQVYSYNIFVTQDSSLITPLQTLGYFSGKEISAETATTIPNPFHDRAEILLDKSWAADESILQVMNIFGDLVFAKNFKGTSVKFSRGKLPASIYFYEVRNKKGKHAVGKFVIE
ncbi:MAG: hypothetical protein ABI763_15890 [Bacteroidota bacterium]